MTAKQLAGEMAATLHQLPALRDEPEAAQVQPHHEWGRDPLGRLANGPEEQAAARRAILTRLETAEELRSLAAGRLLVEAPPGC
jgi:hypothetical protein